MNAYRWRLRPLSMVGRIRDRSPGTIPSPPHMRLWTLAVVTDSVPGDHEVWFLDGRAGDLMVSNMLIGTLRRRVMKSLTAMFLVRNNSEYFQHRHGE